MTKDEKHLLKQIHEQNILIMSALSDLSAAVAQLGTNVSTLDANVAAVLAAGVGSGTPDSAITPITAAVTQANASLSAASQQLAAAIPAPTPAS